jgi:hypothetical protein
LNPAKRTWAQAGRVRLSVTFRRTNSVAWCRDMAAAMFSVCIFGFSRCRPSVRRARSVAEMSQFASRARVGGRGVALWPGRFGFAFSVFSSGMGNVVPPPSGVAEMSQFASGARLRVARRRASAGRFGFMYSVFSSGPGDVVSPPRSVAKRSHFASRPAAGTAQSSPVAPRMRCGLEATFRRTTPAEPDANARRLIAIPVKTPMPAFQIGPIRATRGASPADPPVRIREARP